jgi:hypothetical protein
LNAAPRAVAVTPWTHARGAHDDLANSACGALLLAATIEKAAQWYLTAGGSNTTSLDYAPRDIDEPSITDENYERAHQLRRGHIVNGQPLPWSEIMKRVRAEAALLERRW